jgi:membrane-bound inhibitor of C-type lysozyme
MKYFLALIVVLTLSNRCVKAQQLIIKCGNNSFTVDSTAKLQESFFSCDSIGFMVTGMQGEYKIQLSIINKKMFASMNDVKQNNTDTYYIDSKRITDDYKNTTDIMVNLSKGGKFVKLFKIKLN